MGKTKTQEFLDQVLATVPEDQKAAVRALYSSAQDEIAAHERTLEEETARVRDIATKQTNWWEAHKDTVEENKRLKAAGGGGGSTVNVDEINARIDATKGELMGTGAALVAIGTQIGLNHYKEFGEVLDMEAVMNEAMKSGQTLKAYYDGKMAPRRQELASAAVTKQIEEAELRGVKKGEEAAMTKFGNQHMPFPGHSAPSTTTLSGLKPRADGAGKADVLGDAVQTAMGVMNREAGAP